MHNVNLSFSIFFKTWIFLYHFRLSSFRCFIRVFSRRKPSPARPTLCWTSSATASAAPTPSRRPSGWRISTSCRTPGLCCRRPRPALMPPRAGRTSIAVVWCWCVPRLWFTLECTNDLECCGCLGVAWRVYFFILVFLHVVIIVYSCMDFPFWFWSCVSKDISIWISVSMHAATLLHWIANSAGQCFSHRLPHHVFPNPLRGAQDLQECLANMDDERQYAALGAKVMLSNAHCHGQQRSTGTKAMYANSTRAPAAYPFVWAICACDQVRARLDRYPQFPAVFAIFPQIFSHFFWHASGIKPSHCGGGVEIFLTAWLIPPTLTRWCIHELHGYMGKLVFLVIFNA